MTSAQDIRHVFTTYPDLGKFGFGSVPPIRDAEFLSQVAAVRKWLTTTPDRPQILARRDSYAIKHMIERASGTYISNGAAIAGAILEGFTPVRKSSGPNCSFHRV